MVQDQMPYGEMNFSNAPGQWKYTGSGGETRFEMDPNFMLRDIFYQSSYDI